MYIYISPDFDICLRVYQYIDSASRKNQLPTTTDRKKMKNKNKRRQLVRAPHIKRSARRLAPSQLGSCAHIEHSREERETRGFSSLLRLLSAEIQRERSNLDRE